MFIIVQRPWLQCRASQSHLLKADFPPAALEEDGAAEGVEPSPDSRVPGVVEEAWDVLRDVPGEWTVVLELGDIKLVCPHAHTCPASGTG